MKTTIIERPLSKRGHWWREYCFDVVCAQKQHHQASTQHTALVMYIPLKGVVGTLSCSLEGEERRRKVGV